MNYLINQMKQMIISTKWTQLHDKYTIEDFNQQTKQAIKNIEKEENITTCQDKKDLYHQLDI